MSINTNRQEAKRLAEALNSPDFEKTQKSKQDTKQRQNAWAWPLVYGERD